MEDFKKVSLLKDVNIRYGNSTYDDIYYFATTVDKNSGYFLKPCFVVFNEYGNPEYTASSKEACHFHINEMVGIIEGAGKWIVREMMVMTND